QPIVNGLEEQFDTDVSFLSLNAQDGSEGETYFQQLRLPGHPVIVLFDADGQEVYRGLGIIEESAILEQIMSVLDE
ncbi:MAG: hypothetical protein KC496_21530, partial [Anaerolineae bacterium]|nr:hypothetical protein [Anaerolineae bacterium]